MNQVQIYTLLNSHGFNESDAKLFVSALKENEDHATKADLKDIKADLKDLEIRLLEAINSQTWKFLGGLALLGFAFKVADMLMHR